ncbi:hypothetical protein EYC84_006036 [Monilinia fructicola]|uniref:Alpha/beta hydrolase fold-3 domain-containing protein n=1 Tax=Monilinia fructicola TaxID=38448 RepID=A0A5M9JYF4_MONFR|nr:hypothetical protein EYC84_006036 [Monilinia fructicola]
MIDHVLGRPSVQFRKIQVLAVLSFWSFYLFRGNKDGPPKIRKLSRALSKYLTPWQTLVITLLYLYIARNLGKLVGLECPEPLANLYTRSYFRATWVTTALDAGFWSAMRIRRKWIRDLAGVIFSLYYLIAAEQADEKVRKVRGMFDGGSFEIVLDIPGGGFVAMDPRTNDDKLFAWAGKTGLPVLSLDYKKAPEFPYPYALNECYDVYSTIIASRGRCVGLSGEVIPKVVITGDSAGGNLAASTTLMIIESGSTESRQSLGQGALPIPDGLVLIYPGLDMNIGNWMSEEQMSLIQDRKYRKTNKRVYTEKKYAVYFGSGNTTSERHQESPLPSPQYSTAAPTLLSPPLTRTPAKTQPSAPSTSHHPALLRTRLAMSSMISYFNDRILTPEMMRAMIILYIGPHNRPDFSTDYLLSPILAPDSLLARFPKTYFITGERDPLVDDTVIFAGRLRRCQGADAAEVMLIPGISHGFLQFVGIFPEGWKYVFQCGKWIQEIFQESEQRVLSKANAKERHHRRTRTESSGDEDMGLEMRMSATGKSKGPGDLNGKCGERGRTRLRGGIKRQKSMVSLASEDDLLGRRMLGLVGD